MSAIDCPPQKRNGGAPTWSKGRRKRAREQKDRSQASNTHAPVVIVGIGKLGSDASLPSEEDAHEDRADDQRRSSSTTIDCSIEESARRLCLQLSP